uniref:glutathione transferase n=1 Tax=Bruguiera gymnorhiza TaxID=39984 RepID=F5CRR5_BRUGY|nr:glutathione S-transferase protein [Bruguiera gymnorhiza]
MAEVKLFGASLSPFSRRVEMALKVKGVEYEYIEENLAEKSSLLLEYNPVHKKVPVLVHNRKPIVESLVILEYIDETWKQNPIMPEDPYDRATARFWAKFIDDKCLPAFWQALWSKENEREKAKEEACHHLKTLENELNAKGTKFFGGGTIGLVDIAANFFGYWLAILQEAAEMDFVTKEEFPVFFDWIDEFSSCSAIKESLPAKDKMLAVFQSRFKASTWKY